MKVTSKSFLFIPDIPQERGKMFFVISRKIKPYYHTVCNSALWERTMFFCHFPLLHRIRNTADLNASSKVKATQYPKSPRPRTLPKRMESNTLPHQQDITPAMNVVLTSRQALRAFCITVFTALNISTATSTKNITLAMAIISGSEVNSDINEPWKARTPSERARFVHTENLKHMRHSRFIESVSSLPAYLPIRICIAPDRASEA